MIREIYNDKVEDVARKLKVHFLLKYSYDIVTNPITTIQAHTLTNSLLVTVNGLEAEFGISTNREYKRVKSISKDGEISVLLDHLRSNDVFWDIGANIGTHTVFPAKKLTDGSVVAFEPYPPNAKRLQTNIQKNNLKNVDLEQVALGRNHGEAPLNLEGKEAGHGGHSLGTDVSSDSMSVEMLPGDAFAKKHGFPTVLKIDAQGAELDVLNGLKRVLSTDCRVVFCEVHKSRGVSVSEVKDQLTHHGFQVKIKGSGGTVQLIADMGDD